MELLCKSINLIKLLTIFHEYYAQKKLRLERYSALNHDLELAILVLYTSTVNILLMFFCGDYGELVRVRRDFLRALICIINKSFFISPVERVIMPRLQHGELLSA